MFGEHCSFNENSGMDLEIVEEVLKSRHVAGALRKL